MKTMVMMRLKAMTTKTHNNQYVSERTHVSQCPCCNNIVDESLINNNGIPNQLFSYGYYIHYVHYVFSYGYSFHTLIASFLCSEVAGLYFIIVIDPVCTVHFCSHITAMLANK